MTILSLIRGRKVREELVSHWSTEGRLGELPESYRVSVN